MRLFLALHFGEMLGDVLGVYSLLLEIQQIFKILYLTFELVDGVRVLTVEFCRFNLECDMVCSLYEFECADGFLHIFSRG